jgi:hypothetical protein
LRQSIFREEIAIQEGVTVIRATALAPAEAPRLEFDPYTPVTITWPRYDRLLETPRYAHAKEGQNFVEFTFHPDSGELIQIVLTAAGDATVELRPAPAVASSVAEAVPVVSWEGPSASGDRLSVTVFDDAVEVRGGAGVPEQAVCSGPVGFEFGNDGKLVRFVLRLDAKDRLEFLGSL